MKELEFGQEIDLLAQTFIHKVPGHWTLGSVAELSLRHQPPNNDMSTFKWQTLDWLI